MVNKKKPYRKVVKTSHKSYKTFTLDDFIVVSDEGEVLDDMHDIVYDELAAMCSLMERNENSFYENSFRALVEQMAGEDENAKGKKNAALREKVFELPFPPATQAYNFKEMWRYNIASKIDIYITRYKVEQLIKASPDASPKEIRTKYLDVFDDKAPSVSEIKKYIAAVANSGQIDGLPNSNAQLPLSATDGHYRHLTSDRDCIILSIALACGRANLVFFMPKKRASRYAGKVCAPTIRCKQGRLLFDFAVETVRPKKKAINEVRGFIGVDAGEVNTASWCFVGHDKSISQPFSETKGIRRLEGRICALFDEVNHLRDKAQLCSANGWFAKSDKLLDEAAARRSKISRLKKQCNELVACEIIRTAVALDAGVAVEDLSWVPESHWDHSNLQERLIVLAADRGLPVVRVSAAHTSCTCPVCGGEMVDCGGRRKRCLSCSRVFDRDVAAPRNIGARALGFWDCSGFSYKLFSLGSRALRRECDALARCNKLRSGTLIEDRVNSLVVSVSADSS